MKIHMKKYEVLFCVVMVIALLPSAGFPETGPEFKKCGITSRIGEIKDLIAKFEKNREKLVYFSDNRAEYYKKSQGWTQGAYRGFNTENYSVFFSSTLAGMTISDAHSPSKNQFIINLLSGDIYAAYGKTDGKNLQKPSITIGYRSGRVFSFDIVLDDGARYAYSQVNSIFRISYPIGEEFSYMSYVLRSEPYFVLSGRLGDLVFYDKKRCASGKIVLEDIIADYPHTYLAMILKDAMNSSVDLYDESELALFTVNWFRRKIGLRTITYDSRLDKAAKNHARYIIINDEARKFIQAGLGVDLNAAISLHNETKGRPGFTGVTPSERTVHTGFGADSTECGAFARTNVIDENCEWLHSIFHRRPLVDPRMTCMGHGHAKDPKDMNITTGFASWGYDYSFKTDECYLYPPDKDTMVPYCWDAMEGPLPFPGINHGVGVPITVSFTSPQYKNGVLKIFDSKGKELPCLSKTINPDPDHFIEMVAEYPLEPDTEYTVVFFYGNINKKTSTFRTAPRNPAEIILMDLLERLQAPKGFDPKSLLK